MCVCGLVCVFLGGDRFGMLMRVKLDGGRGLIYSSLRDIVEGGDKTEFFRFAL